MSKMAWRAIHSPVWSASSTFASFILSSIVFPLVGLLRWVSPRLSHTQKMTFRALSLLVSLFPLSTMADAFIATGCLSLDMGITLKRILGMGGTLAAIFTMLVYLWIVLRFNDYESAVTPAKNK